MVANARLVVDDVPDPSTCRSETRSAAKRLVGAQSSVQGLFDTLHAARELKRRDGVEIRRLSHGETDLLRAAVTFAGAGIDAVLKQLLQDALEPLLAKSASARKKLSTYAVDLVRDEPGLAKSILADTDPALRRRQIYLDYLTTGSLQSESQLKAVRDALGIAPAGSFADSSLASHRGFFLARNEIVHELDLQESTGPGRPSRRYRAMSPSRELANDALQLSAAYITATDALL